MIHKILAYIIIENQSHLKIFKFKIILISELNATSVVATNDYQNAAKVLTALAEKYSESVELNIWHKLLWH